MTDLTDRPVALQQAEDLMDSAQQDVRAAMQRAQVTTIAYTRALVSDHAEGVRQINVRVGGENGYDLLEYASYVMNDGTEYEVEEGPLADAEPDLTELLANQYETRWVHVDRLGNGFIAIGNHG